MKTCEFYIFSQWWTLNLTSLSPPFPICTTPLALISLVAFLKILVRPLVLVELGVVVRFTVLHSNAARQDGRHIVPNGLPLCLLLPLLLHLSQLDTWKGDGEDGRRGRDGEDGAGLWLEILVSFAKAWQSNCEPCVMWILFILWSLFTITLMNNKKAIY